MFIRAKPFPEGPKRRIQIIESIRTGDMVRQKIVRHVGVAHTDDEEQKMRQFAAELIEKMQAERAAGHPQMSLFDNPSAAKRGRPAKKKLEDILPPSEVPLSDVAEVERIVEGVHEVGGQAYKEFCFDTLLKGKRDQEILKDIVLARLVSPLSKRGLQKLLCNQFDKEHDLDAIYRMMDKLHGEIPHLKKLCFEATRSLLPKQKAHMLFYDVTTLYFESVESDGLREFGYSKDCRFNTTQVVLALATSEEGLPLGYELFSGDTAEVKTLLKALEGWKQYLDIQDLYFVADRALFTRENLEELDRSGYKYVVAAKLRGMKGEVKEQILEGTNYEPTQIGNHFGWVGEVPYEGKRLIVSYKSERARHDAQQRQTILNKINKQLGASGSSKKLVSNSGVKKYTSMQDSSAYIDEDKIAKDAQWDGMHGVITNDKTISPTDALSKYARLWVIEESFRINKHDLKMRPIYHWTPQRIEAHIALCYMSFSLLRHIEYRVSLTQKLSPRVIMDTLLGVQASIYQHKRTKDLYRMPGIMSHDARKIYKAFGLQRSLDPEIYVKN